MFYLMIRRPPRSTLFPYTTLFRSEARRKRPNDHLVNGCAFLLERALDALRLRRNGGDVGAGRAIEERSEEHTSELQSRQYLVCRLLLEKKKNRKDRRTYFRFP